MCDVTGIEFPLGSFSVYILDFYLRHFMLDECHFVFRSASFNMFAVFIANAM